MSIVLLLDGDEAIARPLTRMRSRFSLRDGIYSPLQRLRRKHQNAQFFYYHPDAAHESSIARLEGLEPARVLLGAEANSIAAAEILATQRGAAAIPAAPLLDALDAIGPRLQKDLDLWGQLSGALRSPAELKALGVQLIGDLDRLYVHANVQLTPGIVIDLRSGPVILDDNVSISAFSYLEGPLYAGPGAYIDNARITGGVIIGAKCRVGGEIENSIFGDFSNKHHEGFVGHSWLGAWVNLGALSTTSDLKNNYGEIRPLQPPSAAELERGQRSAGAPWSSGRIKLGAIIGDCVKTAIGTMIPSGALIDAGANVFGGPAPRYTPPFAWGPGGERYRADRFFADCERIFARRQQSPHSELFALAARFTR
ncbi:MAG: glucose-1-phosphate thymidylyltransferase [Leptospirales bacterium]|nr:glucose-1-phosphate thymidylyltransferase [Leptospirales bacterium]